jgi:hypothetical protein
MRFAHIKNDSELREAEKAPGRSPRVTFRSLLVSWEFHRRRSSHVNEADRWRRQPAPPGQAPAVGAEHETGVRFRASRPGPFVTVPAGLQPKSSRCVTATIVITGWTAQKSMDAEPLNHRHSDASCRIMTPRQAIGSASVAGARPGLQNRGSEPASTIRHKTLRDDVPHRTAQGQRAESSDPELTAVVNAWDRLPDAIRAGILAMVKAASGT